MREEKMIKNKNTVKVKSETQKLSSYNLVLESKCCYRFVYLINQKRRLNLGFGIF